MDDAAVNNDLSIVDFRRGLSEEQEKIIVPVDRIEGYLIVEAQMAFRVSHQKQRGEIASKIDEVGSEDKIQDRVIYEHLDFPGLSFPFI
jgi:hypothetical protein